MVGLHCICVYHGYWGQKAQPWSCSDCTVYAGKLMLLFDPNAWKTPLQTSLCCSFIFDFIKQNSLLNPELELWNACKNEVKKKEKKKDKDGKMSCRQTVVGNCNEGEKKMAAAADREAWWKEQLVTARAV